MTEQVRILIADDEPESRARVRRALQRRRELEIVAEAADGVTAWECVQRLKPDIAIVDIRMPGMDGMELLRRIRRQGAPVDVILLTVCGEGPMIDEAVAHRMNGYLLKHCTSDEILRCIEAVRAGEHYVSPSIVSRLVEQIQQSTPQVTDCALMERLTFQERAVLQRLEHDMSSKEIAREMGLSVRTIDNHRANMCKRLHLHGHHALRDFARRYRDRL